jgi:hypothetical protein
MEVNQAGGPPSIRRPRDIRLDFFRGLALFIILFSHIPRNGWSDWIPARFGFSDSAEIFVFCSGMASGLAFGPLFESVGWLLATARILKRAWQLYWAQIAVFVTIVAMMATADHYIPGGQYLRVGLYLGHFADDPGWMFAHFMTLTYVPNYFDILPMYFGVLLMVPVFAAIASWSRVLALSASALVWLLAQAHLFDLPAEPWDDRTWFFNPFSWQLVFFTGYAIARGWLPALRRRAWLTVAALAVVGVSIPLSCQEGFACFAGWGHLPWLGDLQLRLADFADKTHVGPLRYAHFLALAYLAALAAGEGGRRLRGPIAEIFQQTGRETLPVFLVSMVLAQALGIALDLVGRSWQTTAIANIGGCAVLAATAYVVDWFRNEPWRVRARPAAEIEGAERASRKIAA